MEENKTYEQGLIDAVSTWATVCSSKESCDVCPIGIIMGAGVSCQEFARKFPQKFITLLRQELQGGITFAEEYQTRFPSSGLNAEELVSLGYCRKVIYEGFFGCNVRDTETCLACWNQEYIGDTTVTEEEYQQAQAEYDAMMSAQNGGEVEL